MRQWQQSEHDRPTLRRWFDALPDQQSRRRSALGERRAHPGRAKG